MEKVQVQNMVGRSGKAVPNQIEIFTEKGKYFQSYHTLIAFKPYGPSEKVQLDREAWNYSRTTSRYRSIFLGESTKETERKIAAGEYVLADLN